MGSYVNSNKVSFGESIALSTAMREIAALLGVARRADGKYYLSDICRAGSINPAARYKPVRSSKNANITDADRDAVVGGFGETPQIEPYASGIPHAVYEYDKPRGSAVTPTEWFRLRDFNGYNHEAVFPFHVYFPETLYREGENVIYCVANNSGLNGWDAESCLALADMVDETTRGYNVALLVHRGSSLWLMPSDIKVRDLSASNFPIFRIGRNSDALEQSPSNMMYDYILTDLDAAEGEEYTVAFVATLLGYQSNKSPIMNGIPTMRSLELTYGSDRKTMRVVSAQIIDGLTGQLATTGWSYSVADDPNGQSGWKVVKPSEGQKLTVRLTAPSSWRRTTAYINVQMINQSGMIYRNGGLLEMPVVDLGKEVYITADSTVESDILSHWAYPNQYWFQFYNSAGGGRVQFIITAWRNSSMTGESVELQNVYVDFPNK